MTSIGETLRQERLRRNLELDRISTELKISPRLLEAMEADRFDKLPGGVFTRSFVRQYARQLGLDEQEIAASLERMLNPPPTAAPEIPEPEPGAAVNMALERMAGRVRDLIAGEESRFGWSPKLRALAVFVLVALACAAIFSSLQPRPGTVKTFSNAPAGPAKNPAARASILPLPSSSAPGATATVQPTGGSAERLAAPVHVELSAAAPCWVLAQADGKIAFSGTIEPNASQTVEGNNRVFLKLGNAGGARLLFNGKPVGPFGKDGEVVRVQFTSGGFQIVPAEAGTPGESPNAPPASRTEGLDPL